MRSQKNLLRLIVLLTIFTVTALVLATASDAPQEKVLHSFSGSGKGRANPNASLIFDAAGNLYGTTVKGGAYGYGMVFELTRQASGGWTEKVVHNFNGVDGANPYASLTLDTTGNLYGTTVNGGANNYGTVFELKPKVGRGWIEKVYSFDGTDGQYPYAGIILDAAGNLYGAAAYGGTGACSIQGFLGCGWSSSCCPEPAEAGQGEVLHDFDGTDGANHHASLIFDASGNLYGTTANGGTGPCPDGCGAVFELTPEASGGWSETVPYSFDGYDGGGSFASLVLDASGNLFGTTPAGGGGHGQVFELSPMAGGGWTETELATFVKNNCGAFPNAGVIFDASGNLYGTTPDLGPYYVGTVFEVTPNTTGGWTVKVLHHFRQNAFDGADPHGGLIFDGAGNLYGTTYDGGAHTLGTVLRSSRKLYSSRRPSIAFSIVISSVYSMSLPTGMPMAMRVTFTPARLRCCERYVAVASPSTVGLVATITSSTLPVSTRVIRFAMRNCSGPMPCSGEIDPWRTW